MRKAKVFVNGIEAGILTEKERGTAYVFEYLEGYDGLEISRTMMPDKKIYNFDKFPPFFEGLLPEGIQLDGLLKIKKIDKDDYFSQLIAVGTDLVGVITVDEIKE
ncbi:MAG: HipA N-terminal domain-containing protein [Bacteroidales bacterium]|nr:HipA N-terminal domain-containing protein [Bacteroidales bacterium]